jgi:NAD-dependent deacetylase
VGTSLQVYPVAGTVELARAARAKIVIVNAEPTPFDGIADAVFNDSISLVLPKLLGLESAQRSPQ